MLLERYEGGAPSTKNIDDDEANRREKRKKLIRGWKFQHGARYALGDDEPVLLVSYHPSRQNTQTGRLTEAMFDHVIATARAIVDSAPGHPSLG